jgi:hypothetical protein
VNKTARATAGAVYGRAYSMLRVFCSDPASLPYSARMLYIRGFVLLLAGLDFLAGTGSVRGILKIGGAKIRGAAKDSFAPTALIPPTAAGAPNRRKEAKSPPWHRGYALPPLRARKFGQLRSQTSSTEPTGTFGGFARFRHHRISA